MQDLIAKKMEEAKRSLDRAKEEFGTEQTCGICREPFLYETSDFLPEWEHMLEVCEVWYELLKHGERLKGYKEGKREFLELSNVLITHTYASLLGKACDYCTAKGSWAPKELKKAARGRLEKMKAQTH